MQTNELIQSIEEDVEHFKGLYNQHKLLIEDSHPSLIEEYLSLKYKINILNGFEREIYLQVLKEISEEPFKIFSEIPEKIASRKCIADLKNYIETRNIEKKTLKSQYNSFAGRMFGRNADLKTCAANKIIKILEGHDINLTFK